MLRLVVPLFGAVIAYTDHTYSDRVCVVEYHLACYVIALQRPCLVRPSLTNTEDQRGRDMTISSQVAGDHCKLFRAELVSTPPDGLDTLTRGRR